jgi:hypothetical protein
MGLGNVCDVHVLASVVTRLVFPSRSRPKVVSWLPSDTNALNGEAILELRKAWSRICSGWPSQETPSELAISTLASSVSRSYLRTN